MGDEYVVVNQDDVPEYIEKNGLDGIEDFFKAKLERWKDVEINISVTGISGVGKSSFINAIRGLKDDDEGAAKTGVIETTRAAAVYSHPTNEKIKFWDLPGIGMYQFSSNSSQKTPKYFYVENTAMMSQYSHQGLR